jgi:uncharacterized protein YutE (UPF0331/DUF86 family)
VTDPALIAKKLAFIETCVRELRELARPELLDSDIREQRFVQHTLQLAIQAALDVGSHIVSEHRLGEPGSNRELFELLGRNRHLDGALVASLAAMAGMRNILVHGYQAIDNDIVRDVLANHLDDLLAFVAEIRLQRTSQD